ncbi:MAG: hypothetical protein ACWGMZ_02595, partial [Thermoguttaceae bacterium]
QKQMPESIFKDRPDAPQELVDIFLKMSAKKPEQRYQTMADVAGALTEWLVSQGHTVESATGSTLKGGRKSMARGGKSDSRLGKQPLTPRPLSKSALKGRSSVGEMERSRSGKPLAKPDAAMTDTSSGSNQPTKTGTVLTNLSPNEKLLHPSIREKEATDPEKSLEDELLPRLNVNLSELKIEALTPTEPLPSPTPYSPFKRYDEESDNTNLYYLIGGAAFALFCLIIMLLFKFLM